MPKKPIRPSISDKINSVLYNKLYNEELEKILSFRHEHDIRKELDSLAKRWGLPRIKYKPHTDTVSYSVQDNAVEVIPYKNRDSRVYTAAKTKDNKDEELADRIPFSVEYVGSGKQKTTYVDDSPHLEESRYLTLRIDLDEKNGVLMKQFKEKVDSYKKYAKQRKGRERESTYKHWDIYCFRKEGMTYEEIINKIDPTEEKDILLTRIDVARKAYKKASSMVKAVKPTGH